MNDSRAIYEFGDFALDVARQQLHPARGGDPTPLIGKTFEVLVYLVEHANEPLDKETLLRSIWPGVVVEENSLTQIISGLRQLLGEKRGDNRYIATWPRRGYRFVARVRKRVDRRETQDPEAFAAFASGRVAYLRLTEESLTQAIGYYERAVSRDPHFARAYAGIADCHVLRAVLGIGSPSVEYPKARTAVLTALRLNPTLAAAHVSLAQIEIVHEHRLTAADLELARAVELDPNYAPAYFYRGVLQTYRGDVDAALEAFDRALQLDPVALSTRAARALALFHGRRYDESIASLRDILNLDARFDLARSFLMRVLLAKGEYEEVLSEMRDHPLKGPGSYGFTAEALALAGQREAARAELARVLDTSTRQHVPAFDIARIYAALDDTDGTFMWLERALNDSSPVSSLPLEASFDRFHADPRFASLVARMRA
jgi:DNA-binding winged helix-turn-helix (wHTH) protein